MHHDAIHRVAHQLRRQLSQAADLIAGGAASDELYPQVAAALDEGLQELRTLGLLGRDNEVPSSIVWNACGHLLERGWLQARARGKPRGYPGDYEMLARFYERTICEDPLGRLFDRYFLEQSAPRAVSNRMQMMTDWIVEEVVARSGERLHVSVVGSAFGSEIRDALERLRPFQRERLVVSLLDLDPLALEHASAILSPLLPTTNLVATNLNPLRLLKRPELAWPLAGSDLLFCPGVCDYLTDSEAAAFFRALFAQLAPGGRLFVFQFAPHDPTRTYMEWIGNWYLTYRDAQAFRECVAAANLAASQIHFGAEPLGVDLLAAINHP